MENTSMSRQNYSHKFDQQRSNNQNSKWSFPALYCLVRSSPFIGVMCQPRHVKLPEFEGWLSGNLLPASIIVCCIYEHLFRPLKVLLKHTHTDKKRRQPESVKSIDHARLNSLAIPFNLNASMQNRPRCNYDVLISWMQNLPQITHKIFMLESSGS